jgi:hypothetical protein
MIKSYFKIAWRNLVRNKAFSILNISGLALGMAWLPILSQHLRLKIKSINSMVLLPVKIFLKCSVIRCCRDRHNQR